MGLTSTSKVMEFMGLKELDQESRSLLAWFVRAIEKRIKNRTSRNNYEPEGASITGDTIAFIDSDPDTITDSNAGFVTSGIKAGDVIGVFGSDKNDGVYEIATVVAGFLTLTAGDVLEAESAGATVTISVFKLITEYHDGDGITGLIFTNEFPVRTVESLYDDNVYPHTYASGYLVSTDDYVWYDEGRIELVTGYFNKGLKNIKIIYTAGYSEVPADLEFLATKWSALVFQERKRLGWSSVSTPEGSMTVFDRFLDPGMMATLNSYIDRASTLNP